MALTTKTLVGLFKDELGASAAGMVIIEQPYVLTDSATNTIYPPFIRELTLSSGALSTMLPVDDGEFLTPVGWSYKVTERIDGKEDRVYYIAITSDLPSTVHLNDLDPFTEPPTPEHYVTLGQFHLAQSEAGDGAASQADLDVEIAARAAGDITEQNRAEGVEADLQDQIDGFDPAVMMDDLTDVTITSPSVGDVVKWDGAGWVNGTDETGGGGGGGGGGGISAMVKHMGGDYSLANTAPHAVSFFATASESDFDLVLPASAGDIISFSANFLMNSGSVTHGFDVATIVSDAVVNWFGAGLIDALVGQDGVGGWYVNDTDDIHQVTGVAYYIVQSGDISGGNVTLRMMHAATSSGGTFYFDSVTAMILGATLTPAA